MPWPWPQSLKPIAISLFLLSTTLFFLLSPPNPNKPNHSSSRILLEQEEEGAASCSSILSLPPSRRCSFSLSHCPSSSVLNYHSLHFCHLRRAPRLSLPLLSLLLLLHFRLLSLSASRHFSPVVSRLSSLLRLSPSMAAVTLLALGNGAPDAFASLAALRSRSSSNLPLAALLSAGAFVSAFVVGLVALLAGPFPLSPAPFLRDIFFYLLAASGLFYVYLSAEIYLWQAVGLVGFYVFFVGLVFWMDLGCAGGETRKRTEEEVEVEVEMEAAGFLEEGRSPVKVPETEAAAAADSGSSLGMLGKVAQLWEVPIATLLKLTIPAASPSEWSRFYAAANVGLCPLALLYSFNSFIPMNSQIVFFLPHSHFPIWSVVLFVSLCLAVAHFFLEKEPPPTEAEQIATTLFAFVMSVFWISTTAGELLNCLSALGIILDLPPAILGLTVLAWGNSVGDLVADVSLAKAGQPATAMAGCFAGPMFNMLVGLGTALVLETAKVYPGAYELQFNISVVVAFVFLLLSLMSTLLVVTWSRFRVPRFWGFCLVGLYVLFTAVSLAIARFSG